ncbi:MAG: hypothetical protein HC877_23810 [Thioploca sp.]|nr:hypothetical protein [Thioploca sp.]
MARYESDNCEVCGSEFLSYELETVKIAAFSRPIKICISCLNKTPTQSFIQAIDVISDIKKIAQEKGSTKERLDKIKKLLDT